MRTISLPSRRFVIRRLVLGVGLVALALATALPATAADPAGGSTAAPETAPPPPDEFGRGTPQSTIRGFLEATTLHNYRRAMSYLDLRRIPAAGVATRGPELARQLRVVLDNTIYDLGTVSDEPEGRPETGLAKGRQLVGRIETEKGTFSILLERVPRDDGVPIWQFSNVTVTRIPDLYREVSYGIVGERLLPVLHGAQKFLLVIIVTWLALRLIEVSSQIVRRRLLRRPEPPSQPVIDFIQRGLKIVVSVLAVLMLLEAVGVQVSALIAAIGVGGIGIALAAQRTVENLFGGLAVIGDRPVQEGDFCRVGDQQGTVERIGLWSTRLRTPDRSVITIPNARFLNLEVENLQQRDRILFNTA